MKLFYALLLSGFTVCCWSTKLTETQPLSCERSFDLAIQALKKKRPPLLPSKKVCPVEHKTIAWIYFTRSGNKFEDILQFIKENSFWPDQTKLREKAETSINSRTSDHAVLEYFSEYPPLTSKGVLIYAKRLWKVNPKTPPISKVESLWINSDFKPKDEAAFHRFFKKNLSTEVYRKRLDRLILEGNYYGLERMKLYVSKKCQKVINYALTLLRKRKRFYFTWARIPDCYKQYPGLTVQRIRWLLKKNEEKDALKLFQEGIRSGVFEGHPDLLLRYRNYFSRYFLHKKDFQKAYEISIKNPVDPKDLKSKVDYTEGEWLTGWLELRNQKKPAQAKKRFEGLYALVSTSISKSKMAYWAGRSEEEQGNNRAANHWYQESGQFYHTYYGQLSLKKMGRSLDIKLKKKHAHIKIHEKDFRLVKAIRLLTPYGFSHKRERLFLYLAKKGQSNLGEFLVHLSYDVNMSHLAVILAKFMGQKSPVLTEKAYPTVTLSPKILGRPFIDDVLVHSIIRQESNFNSRSISTAGARGFMQLMYSTARRVARKLRIKLRRRDLTKQPHKNLEIGSSYLSSAIKRFKGNYVVALAGYNAGPEKAEEWVRIHGNPSSKHVDTIDWIESIPYGETRGYIQRITESLAIYAKRLGKKSMYP